MITLMRAHLIEFIESKRDTVTRAVKARKSAAHAWRNGTDKSWKSVGCHKTRVQRLALADMEDKILAKLRRELELFNEVLEIISKQPITLGEYPPTSNQL